VCFAFVIGVGASWRLVIASAPWTGRWGHTSVIDAAGAIYVLGGRGSGTFYQDVWASTDGGARPDSRLNNDAVGASASGAQLLCATTVTAGAPTA
jgi:hypothetical protein